VDLLFDPSRWNPTRFEAALGVSLGLFGGWLVASITVAAVHHKLPERWRQPWLIGASLVFLGWAMKPEVAVFAVGFTVLLHQLVFTSLLPKKARTAAGGALLAGLFLPAVFLGPLLDFEGGSLVTGDKVAVFFLVILFKKSCYALYESRHGVALTAGQAAVYFLSLPFLLGKAIVVSPTNLFASQDGAPAREALLSGARTLGLAALHLLAFAALVLAPAHLVATGRLVQDLASVGWVTVYAALALNYVAIYLFRYGWEQMAVGGARLLGYAVADNYENPLAARDYADFWRRWNVHFREMIVRIFYYPTVLALSRRWPQHKKVAVVLACCVTFIGHGAFMVFNRGVLLPLDAVEGWWELTVALGIYEVFQAVLTASALLLMNKKRRAAWGRPWLVAGVLLTFHLRAAMVLLILRGGLDLAGVGALLGRLVGAG
jgi:alginate O-acetyltransferase complex protein AlgI